MLELRNSSGQLDFSNVSPDIVATLDEPQRLALISLMDAVAANSIARDRKNAAVKRLYDAEQDEIVKQQAHLDASSPIPFTVKAMEDQLGRPLNAGEMKAAREQHAIHVRGLLEQRARIAAVEAYNSSH